MKTTHFPGHLKAVAGYLARHPRVRLSFGDPPHREVGARFLYRVRRAKGIHHGALAFCTDRGHRVRLAVIGGDTWRVPAGVVPAETGIDFEPGGFRFERGGEVVRVAYREGPAMLSEGED